MPLRLQQLLLLIAILAAWELVADLDIIDAFFISSPTRIAETLDGWVADGSLLHHIAVTTVAALIGFLVGVAAGAAAGLACALVPALADAALPLITAGNSLPKLAFAPLLIGWFGLGAPSKIALAASIVFFFIFFAVYSGARTIDRTILANARVLGGSRAMLLRHVYLPATVGWVIAGVRLGLAYAFAAAVVGEFFGGNAGLGYLIVFGQEMLNLTEVFAGLTVVVAIVGMLDTGLRHLERRNTRWQGADRDIRS